MTCVTLPSGLTVSLPPYGGSGLKFADLYLGGVIFHVSLHTEGVD